MNSPAIIDRFSGEWEFLNNYFPATIQFDNELYTSVEHAYQAAKSTNASVRDEIRRTPDPDEAKRLGRKHANHPNWDNVKVPLMRRLVARKFREPVLAAQLVATGDAHLVEGNNWGDTFWGECDGVGDNHMGRILMDLRAELRQLQADGDTALRYPAGTVIREAEGNLATRFGATRLVVFTDDAGSQLVVVIVGDVSGRENVLVRVHSACFTGDVLGSTRCDCGDQLALSMQMINESGKGVFIYMSDHEGRGIGLIAKVFAYDLQDSKGLDTIDANVALGVPVDARDYAAAAAVLNDIGVKSIRLLSNNPDKEAGLSKHGITIVSSVPILVEPGEANHGYLSTKRDRMGHQLPHLRNRPSGDA